MNHFVENKAVKSSWVETLVPLTNAVFDKNEHDPLRIS